MKKLFSSNEIETVAREILSRIEKSASNERATVVALSGDLGAGKTTLTQGLARALGVRDSVISPTFVIMKKYPLKGGAHEMLVHIDAYRLNKASELSRLGWEALIADPKNLILIEWPEKVAEIMPQSALHITLAHASSSEREISIE